MEYVLTHVREKKAFVLAQTDCIVHMHEAPVFRSSLKANANLTEILQLRSYLGGHITALVSYFIFLHITPHSKKKVASVVVKAGLLEQPCKDQ